MWWKCIILCWTIMHEADMTDVSFNLTCLQFAIIIITYSLWKFSFLLKTWKLQEVFCYVPCPVRTWAIMGFHNFLSCVALSSFCPITISQSLFCHPFIKVWFSGISQWWYTVRSCRQADIKKITSLIILLWRDSQWFHGWNINTLTIMSCSQNIDKS